MEIFRLIFQKAILSRLSLSEGERPAVLHSEKVRIFQKVDFASPACKRNIEMTALCQLEMTLPGGLWGEGVG